MKYLILQLKIIEKKKTVELYIEHKMDKTAICRTDINTNKIVQNDSCKYIKIALVFFIQNINHGSLKYIDTHHMIHVH